MLNSDKSGSNGHSNQNGQGDNGAPTGASKQGEPAMVVSTSRQVALRPPPNRFANNTSPDLAPLRSRLSPQAEALWKIQTKITHEFLVKGHRTLAVVSPGRKEGRTYLAANLAGLYSQRGKKVLLIDGDLRNPRQHEIFTLNEREPTLTEMLQARSATGWLRKLSGEGLVVVSGGNSELNPMEILTANFLSELLERAQEIFEVILIDTPCAEVGDGEIFAELAGSAIVVARKNKSNMSAMSDLAGRLRGYDVKLGAVINDF